MADYTSYPTAGDVEALLKSAKYWPADGDTSGIALAREQAAVAAAGAAREFETRTGWLPFLAKPNATTRFFDATDGGGLLEFGAGLQGTPEPVFALAADGSTIYAKDVSYWLQPANAEDQGLPYTRIQSVHSLFGGRVWSYPNRLKITGRWGYCSELPPDVWVAIQKKAGVEVLASIENLQSIASISQDGFSNAYDVVGIITQKDVLERWGKDFDRFCTRYTRVVV